MPNVQHVVLLYPHWHGMAVLVYMTIDPRIPNAGTEHVGVSPTRQKLLAPPAKRREV